MPVIGKAGYRSGFDYALVWLQASGGRMGGRLGTAVVNGQDTGAYYVKAVKTTGLQYAAPTVLDIPGGDKIVATEEYGNAKLNPFDLELSITDLDLIAMVTGTGIEESETEFPRYSLNPYEADLPVCGLLLGQRFQPRNTGTDGPRFYHHTVVPRATIRPKFGAINYQAEGPLIFTVTPSFTDRMPTGDTFASTDMGIEYADHYGILSESRIYWHLHVADGTDTGFTSPYLPVSELVSPLADADHLMYVNGTATAITSIDDATGAVVLPVGTAGQYRVVQIKTAFTPSS